MSGPENPPANALTGSSTDGPVPDNTPNTPPPTPAPTTVTTSNITDASSVGKAVLTAADQQSALQALGFVVTDNGDGTFTLSLP